MNNKKSARAFLLDAEIIIDECSFSFEREHWHRVIRKCQEATEFIIKGLFRYLGIDFPKSHILGRVIKKELGKYNVFGKEELGKLAFISDALAFDREPSFYGSPEGIPAAELFDRDDAEEAMSNTQWVFDRVRRIIENSKD